MKLFIISCILAAAVIVECGHTFMGTNFRRTLVHHRLVKFNSKMFRERVEYVNFTVPVVPGIHYRPIQGILAYDLTHSGASANVTRGGIGYNFVNIRMKSEIEKKIFYNLMIYI